MPSILSQLTQVWLGFITITEGADWLLSCPRCPTVPSKHPRPACYSLSQLSLHSSPFPECLVLLRKRNTLESRHAPMVAGEFLMTSVIQNAANRVPAKVIAARMCC
jgi:hypothetical protein